jgi:anti-anti-sigma factor
LAAAADGFRIESSLIDGSARLELWGEVDAATAPLLDAKITEAVDAGAEQVVLACADLAFIDSSGLSVLVASHKRLRTGGCRLVVESPPPAAQRLFEIAGLDRVLDIRHEGPDGG